MRVLVVEDSYSLVKTYESSLHRQGFDVVWAANLGEALDVLSMEADVDAVLLDLNLPDSAGLDTFHRVVESADTVPVVVISSQDDVNVALEALQCGAQDYIIKGHHNHDDRLARSLRHAIEREKVEARLRANEKRTRLILENCTDAFITCDSEGMVKGWNRQAEIMFGWKYDEIVGKTLAETIIPPRLLAVHKRDLARLKQDTSGTLRRRGELVLLHQDGSEIPVEIGLFPVHLGEGEDELCAFVHDISYRKQIEQRTKQLNEELERRVHERTAELARSNAELHQFAKIASHDLQEPLRAIEGYARLLAKRYKGQLDQDADEFIDFILDGTDRMVKLIKSVLQHASIGNSDVKTVQLVDCRSVLQEVMSNLQVSIEESGAKVVVEELPTVVANRTELLQLFQNLISNAIKYRDPERQIVIRVRCEENVHEWVFAVEDNGIGIPPQYTERIFDMFARLHGKTQYQGTGIGLAMCKKIVETHGGRIWVQSEPGHGSIFLFTLLRFRPAE